jgi:UDP-2,3-diacylglucosamine pyrophosphatase LpxH
LQEAIAIRNKVTPATKEYLRRGGHFGEFQEAVKNHMNHGAKIVIFGHTHRCQLQMMEKGIYANCGSWVDGVNPTYIAYYQERIELKEAFTHKTIKQTVTALK